MIAMHEVDGQNMQKCAERKHHALVFRQSSTVNVVQWERSGISQFVEMVRGVVIFMSAKDTAKYSGGFRVWKNRGWECVQQ